MLTTYVDSRLEQWALWRARREDSGIGFPKQSAFAKEAGSGSFGAWTPAMNDEAAEIDQCVVALIEVRREAIMQMYCRTSTLQQKYKECFCCERTFFNRLKMGKIDILGFLNDLAADVPLPNRSKLQKTA
jgi:hypothetical protein